MNEKPQRTSAIVNIMGTIITVATVVFGGGALYQRVSANETRLSKIESVGTASLGSHESKDDERDIAIRARVQRLEIALENLQELRADIREIKADIRNLVKP